MFDAHSQAILEICRDQHLIEPQALHDLNEEHKATGKPLAALITELNLVEKDTLLAKIAENLGLDYIAEPPTALTEEQVASLPGSLARMYGVVPLRGDSISVDLLATDPFNNQIIDDLTFALGKDVRLIVTDPEKVEALIRLHYGDDGTGLEDLLRELSGEGTAGITTPSDEESLSDAELENQANATPIIRFVNLVLGQAIKDKASDVHFEPFEHEFKIRYRIDGALYEMSPPPKHLALPITSRIKVLSNLNIAERRVPQDGRIKLTVNGKPVDLRVSTLPTQFGESVVLRVLDQSAVQLEIGQLGMPEDVYEGIHDIIHRPNGIFIVTGPTGSGKTTTLYSALRIINTIDLKLLTAEDPVEYEIEGIMQVPVNHAVGLTFASALRSFLRQDPDVIMVGEIRDLETAQISIQASLTGHLVLSTLHTNDAAGAVTRLVDMGVEPFLIASSLEAVLAQRLVRRICSKCRTAYEPPADLLQQLGIDPIDIGDREFFYGKGCEHCSDTGYRGRMGIYEWLRMSEAVRDLVVQRAPTLVIKQKALEQGMRTLRDDGLRAIFDGATTIEEVVKYT
ncbi:type II secretory pathway, ATPase PulE/Tfp pilus assembly pathway, ATPase PilB [Opitutaceae bacterium TAV1]|nr:type IV fimbrial assembly protein PilB [Opitutaceae bacterium TAV5]EIQ01502.1 type II secretory pathway, ATPase PulE/Tfp pilus assembly pathway, ATPase PilB [Opitutaceae bacterium TAV1]